MDASGFPASDRDAAVLKLHAWLSPSYPVGAYAYSHGMEHSASAGVVTDTASTEAWIRDVLELGSGRNDAILLVHAWRGAEDPVALRELSELASAFAPSLERLLETEAQGAAFDGGVRLRVYEAAYALALAREASRPLLPPATPPEREALAWRIGSHSPARTARSIAAPAASSGAT